MSELRRAIPQECRNAARFSHPGSVEKLAEKDGRQWTTLNPLDVFDQVVANGVPLVVLFTNGTKQFNPPPKLIVPVEPVRFGRTDWAVANPSRRNGQKMGARHGRFGYRNFEVAIYRSKQIANLRRNATARNQQPEIPQCHPCLSPIFRSVSAIGKTLAIFPGLPRASNRKGCYSRSADRPRLVKSTSRSATDGPPFHVAGCHQLVRTLGGV